MRLRPLVLLFLASCCSKKPHRDPVQAEKDMEELDRKVAAQRAADDAARSARPVESMPPLPAPDKTHFATPQRAAQAAAVEERKAFAEKIKRNAKCASSVTEGERSDTLHVEGCEDFPPPLTDPAPFGEAKRLGFERIHNHSIGKAWCSYYIGNYPAQKTWKCNNTGGAWPGP